ncbi:MAG: hypothetical protein WAR37_01210 [Candidatus Microsaccharimonas sp.]
MADFDFDEIDKAVTGALNKKTNASTTPDLTYEESVAQPVEQPQPVPAKPAVSSAPAIRRSAGRFMDVVHPSSDMRPRTAEIPPVAQPTPPEPVVVEPTLHFEEEPLEEVAQFDWQDPLESPFLAGTKVEKRPLGGEPWVGPNIKESIVEQPIAKESEIKLIEAPDDPLLEAHTMPDPIDFAAQNDILPSEKEDTETQKKTNDEEELFDLQTFTRFEAEQEQLAVKPQELVIEEQPVGPVSITQQYTEQPSLEEASGAIYDTENYHQPFSSPVKKKSGGLTILWIFLLIILGAGAGAAFYFFVLPML